MIGGEPLIGRCLAALSPLSAEVHGLLTDSASEAELRPWAERAGWRVFVGSADNVLDRYVKAAREWGIQTIIRATGDNPLLSARQAQWVYEVFDREGADFCAAGNLPVGTGVEVVRTSALEAAWSDSPDAYEREHVSPFLYRRPERFRIVRVPASLKVAFPQGRVTIDTSEDLEYVRRLWRAHPFTSPPEIEEFLPWLQQNPR